MNQVYAEADMSRGERWKRTQKAPRSIAPRRLRDRARGLLSPVENVRADLLDDIQPVTPRRSDIVGVIPEHVAADAWDDIRHRQPGNALSAGPGGRTRVDPRKLAMTHERELCGLLDDAAPVRRVPPGGRAVHYHTRDRELAFNRFTTRLEIDRSSKAIALLVERRAGAVTVDQSIKRPAGAVEPRTFGRDGLAQRNGDRTCRLR